MFIATCKGWLCERDTELHDEWNNTCSIVNQDILNITVVAYNTEISKWLKSYTYVNFQRVL